MDLDSVSSSITHVRILTLSGWSPFDAAIGPTLSTRPSTFLFHELKELWWIDNSLDKYDIDAQLSFLKLCPSLEKLFITIDPRSYGTPSRSECQVK
ncbi:F-box protein [Vitis vinifera]|uniref:F-box protein n=1 Tax=Vitis vinifera TaxID=29760 RepID=A0A438JXA2_VITVI|nr:F-box protein [Vitis vinifera]